MTRPPKGATDVNGLWFEVSDPAAAMDQARAAAITQARTSAAGDGLGGRGRRCGAVVSISETSSYYPGPYYGAAGRRP